MGTILIPAKVLTLLPALSLILKQSTPSLVIISSVVIWQISLSLAPVYKAINGIQKKVSRIILLPGLKRPLFSFKQPR